MTKENKEENEVEKSEEEEGESKTLSANERAEKNIAALKTENDRMDANVAKMEEFRATDMLSGTANAGQTPAPKETEDEKWAKEAKSRYEGTGMDPTPSGDESGF